MTDSNETLPSTVEVGGRKYVRTVAESSAKERDEILFEDFKNEHWQHRPGSIVRTDVNDVDVIEQLMKKGYMSAMSRQNESPTAIELFRFMVENEEFKAEVYAYSPYREDPTVKCGAVIEGIHYEGQANTELLERFTDRFKTADRYKARPDYMVAWWG